MQTESFDIQAALAVEGQISEKECLLLYTLAKRVSKGVIVEVGSYRGRSTVALALGTRAGAKVPVYAVDPHEVFTGVLGGTFGPQDRVCMFRNLLDAGVAESVAVVGLPSQVAAQGWESPIGLLWIDGDHTLAGTEADFRSWGGYVRTGGLVAFHDATDPQLGPFHVIRGLLSTDVYRKVGQVDHTIVLQKAR